MLVHFEHYSANFSFIVVSFFLYQMLWIGKYRPPKKFNQFSIFFFSGIAMILCMTFPMKVFNGVYFDLRMIPFITAVFYGNTYVGLSSFLLINLYRLLHGGVGVYYNLIVTALILIFLLIYKKRFKNSTTLSKSIVVTLTAILSAIVIIFLANLRTYTPFFNQPFIPTIYVVSQGFGMLVITFTSQTLIENIKMQKNLLLTEKLRAISELSASISHEVRNPMTVTKGFLQLLHSPNITQTEKEYYLKISLTELERAEMIINDYLSMTKPQKTLIARFDLNDEIVYVTNVIKPYATIHNVVIENHSNKQVPLFLDYDRNQLRQCLINLMKNCIEAMSCSGGKLTVQTSRTKEHIQLVIHDTGVGMTKEQIRRLGTPYYTTKEKGTGLGMTVVFSTIQALNGNIQVESEKDIGTSFTITFPISA